MENLLNPYEKQYMKMAILKHEETFKLQVNELHRLYQVQKILMKNMQTNKGNNINSGLETFKRTIDHESDRSDRRDSGGNNTEIVDESEIELTLGPSSYSGELMRMNKKNKRNSLPEMMDGNVNSGRRSFSSSLTGSSNNNYDSLDEQVKHERLMKHHNQKQPWLRALTLNNNIHINQYILK